MVRGIDGEQSLAEKTRVMEQTIHQHKSYRRTQALICPQTYPCNPNPGLLCPPTLPLPSRQM